MRYGLITANDKPVPLKSIDVHVSITGTVAFMLTDFHYENDEEENPIEAVFVLPLESGISICGFQAEIDGRIVQGRVEEKEKARDVYDDAISSGQTAFLMEESSDSDDIFKISVGNLPPKKTAKVTTKAFCTLKHSKDGRINFVLPTILNPRYSPAPTTDGTQATQEFDNWSTFSGKCSVKVPYTFSLDADIQCATEILEVASNTHPINVSLDGSKARVDIKNIEEKTKDVEFVIKQKTPFLPHAFLELPCNESKKNFLSSTVIMLNYFPLDVLPEDTRATAGDYIFLIDRSGSMGGSRIEDAKASLLLFLKSLPTGSKFNIISFGSDYEFLYPGGSKEYNNENVSSACDIVSQMIADMGGTEILKPLLELFKAKKDSTINRRVFLITDGQVSNTNQVISAVKKENSSSGTRFFTLGIGHGCSTALIKSVAAAGSGVAEFARDSKETQSKVITLVKAASYPCLSNLSLKWKLKGKGLSVAKQIPSQLEKVSVGESLTVFAELKGTIKDGDLGTATVSFKVKDKSYERDIMLEAMGGSGSHSTALHCCAAKMVISQQVEDKDRDQHKLEVIELSKAVNVLSSFTAFVAVDVGSQERLKGVMLQRRVPPIRLACAMPMSATRSMPTRRGMALSGVEKKKKCKGGIKLRSVEAQAMPIYTNSAHQMVSLNSCVENKRMVRGSRLRKEEGSSESDDDWGEEESFQKEFHKKESRKKEKVADRRSSGGRQGGPSHLVFVSMQSVDGSWSLNSKLASQFGKQLEALKRSMPSILQSIPNPETIWATCLALQWLSSSNFDNVRVELGLILEKARNWLKDTVNESQNLSLLELAAKATLGL